MELKPGNGGGTPDCPRDSERYDTDDTESLDKNNLLSYIQTSPAVPTHRQASLEDAERYHVRLLPNYYTQ